MLIDTYGIVDDAVCWCVGLSGLFISWATKTEAFDLGRHTAWKPISMFDSFRSSVAAARESNQLFFAALIPVGVSHPRSGQQVR